MTGTTLVPEKFDAGIVDDFGERTWTNAYWTSLHEWLLAYTWIDIKRFAMTRTVLYQADVGQELRSTESGYTFYIRKSA